MAINLNSLLNMGTGALNASQSGIQVTGNNIANVNTQGYSRQQAIFNESPGLNYSYGQFGTGVETKEIVRYFDKFIESAFLGKNSMQNRYNTEYSVLHQVESLFNESNTDGIGAALNSLYSAWNELAQNPKEPAVREALLQKANTLASAIRTTSDSLKDKQREMDGLISTDVDKANKLIKEIAQLNRNINISSVEGRNNPNELMDVRDEKVRELSSILDVAVEDKGAGHYSVFTSSGLTLVQEDVPYSLQFSGNQVDKNLFAGSTYNGSVDFSGSDGSEYTIEITRPGRVDTTGAVPPPEDTALFKVSLDGGKTWLTNEDGSPMEFSAADESVSVHVKNIDISFTGTTELVQGDSFTISPKNDVYWVSPTSEAINISTQIYDDGQDNQQRITGGTLAGYLTFRDSMVGGYIDRLDSLSRSVIWEINRIHSQGAGLEKLTSAYGTEYVDRTNIPLGSPSSGFDWYDKLQNGNISFQVYDAATGTPVIDAATGKPIEYPGISVSFDPEKDSLEELRDKINNSSVPQYLKAEIVDSRLEITPFNLGDTFGVTADTTGVIAGLGINTFFKGSSAADMATRDDFAKDISLINAGKINGASEGNEGDNITAKLIAALANKKVSITMFGHRGADISASDYYATIVSKVGSDTYGAKYSYSSESSMAEELSSQREAVSGVSLDEELSNLIKFQSSYKAAAKLITTADQMLQTLLSLKQ